MENNPNSPMSDSVENKPALNEEERARLIKHLEKTQAAEATKKEGAADQPAEEVQKNDTTTPPNAAGKSERAGVSLPQFEEVPEDDPAQKIATKLSREKAILETNDSPKENPKTEKLKMERAKLSDELNKLKSEAEKEIREVRDNTFEGQLLDAMGSNTLENAQEVKNKLVDIEHKILEAESIKATEHDSQNSTEEVSERSPKTAPSQKSQKKEGVFARQYGVENASDLKERQKKMDRDIKKLAKQQNKSEDLEVRVEGEEGAPASASQPLSAGAATTTTTPPNAVGKSERAGVRLPQFEEVPEDDPAQKIAVRLSREKNTPEEEIETPTIKSAKRLKEDLETLRAKLEAERPKKDRYSLERMAHLSAQIKPTEEEIAKKLEREKEEEAVISGNIEKTQELVLSDAEKIGEKGWLEKLGQKYNEMPLKTRIGFGVSLLGLSIGGSALGVPTALIAGGAMLYRSFGSAGRYAKYKKFLEEGVADVPKNANIFQKMNNWVDKRVLASMQKARSEGRDTDKKTALAFSLMHMALFTGGFTYIAQALGKLDMVKEGLVEMGLSEEADTAVSANSGTEQAANTLNGSADTAVEQEADAGAGAEQSAHAAHAAAEQISFNPFSLEISKGDGAIAFFEKFKAQLAAHYPEGARPLAVEKVLAESPVELAQKYGFYKPGEAAESALLRVGDTLDVDAAGNVLYKSIENGTTILESANGAVHGQYMGEMFDYQTHLGAAEIAPLPDTEEDITTAPENTDTNKEALKTAAEAPSEAELSNTSVEEAELTPAQQAALEKMIDERATKEMNAFVNDMLGKNSARGFLRSLFGNETGVDSEVWKDIGSKNAYYILNFDEQSGSWPETNKISTIRTSKALKKLVQEMREMSELPIQPTKNETVSDFMLRLFKIRAIDSMPQS